MNKIISINLCSIIFQIDEIAYENLKKYLFEIKQNLGSSASANEVYVDVENRIAELFQQKLNDGAQAILPKDVEELMSVMGQPSQFKEFTDDNTAQNNSSHFEHDNKTNNQFRRIYRNPNDKVLGGVCSGLAAYLGIDPIIIRLAFVALFFVGGTSFLIYLICWIAIPKAITAAEKMAMNGKSITFDEIKKNVQREANNVKDNFERMSYDIKNNQNGSDTVRHIAKVLVKVIAFLFLIFGLMIFVPLALALLAVLFSVGFAAPIVLGFLTNSATDAKLLVFAACCMIFIPIVAIIYKLIRLIFKSNPISTWVKTAVTVLWFASIISIVYIAQKITSDFKYDKTITEQISFTPTPSKTIYLNSEWLHDNTKSHRRMHINIGIWGNHNFGIMDTIANGNIELKIATSPDSLIHLLIEKSAQGPTDSEAQKRAASITYNASQNDSILILPHYFTKAGHQMWRNQEVNLILQIPNNKQISLSQNALDLLDDDAFQTQYENLTDEIKINTKWIITSMGLKEAK
ncbi:MAG: hypothetical protein RIQ33_1591 [Bacteroidota bacterium]